MLYSSGLNEFEAPSGRIVALSETDNSRSPDVPQSEGYAVYQALVLVNAGRLMANNLPRGEHSFTGSVGDWPRDGDQPHAIADHEQPVRQA
jgi:hypothetical protein